MKSSVLRPRRSVPLSLLIVVVIWLLSTVAASTQTQTIYCGSEDGRRHTCSVNTHDGVHIQQQKSSAECVQGRSWGYKSDYIWVDRGCRADFEITDRNYDRNRDRDRDSDRDRDRDRDRNRNAHGSVTWTGKVDHDVKLAVYGSQLDMYTMSGKAYPPGRYYFSGSMPRDAVVSVRHIKGRNEVYVEEQPSRRNDYKASIRIKDGRGGSDDCEVVISW
jgi:hypothetical protein